MIEVDGLIHLPKSSFNRAVDVLTRAFWDYELNAYFFSSDKRHEKFQRMYCKYSLNQGMIHGDILTTSPNVEGMAIWTHSDSQGHGILSALRGGGLMMIPQLGIKRVKEMLKFKDYADGVREKYAPKPHMHLTSLAVDPDKQGQGYCSKTVRPVFEYLDRIKLPCYLETQSESNVAIYEHYGFEVVSEEVIPDMGLTHWGMVRMPR